MRKCVFALVGALKVNPDPTPIAAEGALWGGLEAHGLLAGAVIPGSSPGTSDDAGLPGLDSGINVGQHGLCWAHAERLVHKLDAFTDARRAAQRRIRALIWRFYRSLKADRRYPTTARKAALQTRFDRIFASSAGFAALDHLLARLHANNSELLKALDRPEIPLRANASQNDIRRRVIRRKISGGTRSDAGRDRHDAFLGLAKTCAKLGVAFSDYLGARLLVPGSATIPFLPEIVSVRAAQPP